VHLDRDPLGHKGSRPDLTVLKANGEVVLADGGVEYVDGTSDPKLVEIDKSMFFKRKYNTGDKGQEQ